MCTHHCYITHTATPSTLTHTHLLTLHTSLRQSAHTHKHTHIQSCQAPSLLHGFRSKLCELPACSVSHTHTHPYLTDTQYTQTQRHTHPYIHIRTVRIQIHITPHHPPPHAHSYTPTATDRHTRAHTHTSLSPCPDSRPAPLLQAVLLGQVPRKGAVAATQAPGWATLHQVWPVLPAPDAPSARLGHGGFADARPPVWRGPAPARSAGPRRAARPGSGSALPPAAPPPGCEPRSPAEPPAPGSAAAALCPPSPPPALPPRAPALSPPPPPARGPRSAPDPAGRRARTAAPSRRRLCACVPTRAHSLSAARRPGRAPVLRSQPGAGSRTLPGRPIIHIHSHDLPGKHRGLEHRVHSRVHTRARAHTRQPAQARRTTFIKR